MKSLVLVMTPCCLFLLPRFSQMKDTTSPLSGVNTTCWPQCSPSSDAASRRSRSSARSRLKQTTDLLSFQRWHSLVRRRRASDRNICCFSILGLRPLKDLVFVVFEGESFRETLLTSSAVVKCDGLALGAFPGCVTRCFTLTSQFLPPRPATG